jgi:hypothetical protein
MMRTVKARQPEGRVQKSWFRFIRKTVGLWEAGAGLRAVVSDPPPEFPSGCASWPR